MPIEDDAIIREILKAARTIAVVGASVKPWRDSNSVMQYLMESGYEVVPVNPNYEKVLGIPCHPSLATVGKTIDIVDVFRRAEAVGSIVDETISVGAKTLWLQSGIINEAAAEKAERAGLNVIMDRCIRVDHQRLFR